jgi:hypothetical protein
MLFSLITFVFIFYSLQRINSVYLDFDLNQPAQVPLVIDLNQPVSAESPNEPVGQAENGVETMKAIKIKTRSQTKYETNKRYLKRLRTKPEKYDHFLTNKRTTRKKWFENLSEESKKRHREKSALRHKKWLKGKREKDPSFRLPDKVGGIRKRLREGVGTKEDFEKQKALSDYNREYKRRKRQQQQ